MFRIRRIYDDVVPANRRAIAEVQELFREQFPGAPEEDAERLPERLRNPFLTRFRAILFVAESAVRRRRVLGFALLLHDPEDAFAYLDYIATRRGRVGGGVGSALYDRVRSEARALGARALFFECLPDEVEDCPDPALHRENRARLRFYERFGARPVIGTGYTLPIRPGDVCMPYLVVDPLDRGEPLRRDFVRGVIRAVLERKYGNLCPADYVDRVVASVQDDPVRLRPPRYGRQSTPKAPAPKLLDVPFGLVVSDRHEVHHVHDRGYVEAPARLPALLAAAESTGLFERVAPRTAPQSAILAVHAPEMVRYLEQTCTQMDEKSLLYPYVFPIRNQARPPKDSSVKAGYYCIDTFTPLSRAAWMAARRGVDCAVTGAEEILAGRRAVYVLVRPPGHHAERAAFGGFCYLNNVAIAAERLAGHGPVALLDVDYHHGNGAQDIFWRRSDVLTVSIHGHPRFAYPYFSGFEEERGEGAGEGFNLNIPLPEQRDGAQYRRALARALARIEAFGPAFLVVALGLDPAKGDPTGTWSLTARDFRDNGRLIGSLGVPTLMVQEGGYRIRSLGANLRAFVEGLAEGMQQWRGERSARAISGVRLRDRIAVGDVDRLVALAERTGAFRPEEVEVLREILQEAVSQGTASGYRILIGTWEGQLAGFCCFGEIPCTQGSFDLYWICVEPALAGRHVGRRLLRAAEARAQALGGRKMYVDTSGSLAYARTRRFYERAGYRPEAVLEDFYLPGEGKVIYSKALAGGAEGARRAGDGEEENAPSSH